MLPKPFTTINLTAPKAAENPVKIDQHGDSRIDPYQWMRDDHWQEVLRKPSVLKPEIRRHLDAENEYYEGATKDLTPLREQIFTEMRGRIKENDSSVPMKDGDFAYSVRYREGGEYAVFVRTAREGGNETILFDGDKEAVGADFFDIGAVAHSPNHKLLAIAVDRLGSEYFDIRIRPANGGKEHEETINSTDGNPVWTADSGGFYYVERDDNQRSKWVKYHQLGTPCADDPVIYEEPDDGFFLSISKTQSSDYIIIHCANSMSSEVRFLRSCAPANNLPKLVAARAPDELYDIDHHGEYFYIRTNAGKAIDFKLCRTPVKTPDRESWEEWLPHQPGNYLLGFTPYKDRIVRISRRNALPEIVISSHDRKEEILIGFDEDAYALGVDPGYEFDTHMLRLHYSSMTTPRQTFDYDMRSGVKTLLKTQEVPSGHNPDRYVTERLYAKSHDGEDIPVTILRLKSVTPDTEPPLLLYGYGSYGITIPTGFSTGIFSIVDRGGVYAIAHIRGGAAKGRQWYLDGKLHKKTNTFLDFVAVAQMLQSHGFGKNNDTVIYGGSAGGLLVGAAVNLQPDLFAGVIGAVPFVDVVNTISDASLPLTPPEWDEWGNPIEDAAAYRTILSYSPYDNIRSDAQYPPILATGGLADYRVTYWEPAKWIARLRENAKGGPFFLKMNMEAGHGGSAARFEGLKEKAHDYAFALKIFGLS